MTIALLFLGALGLFCVFWWAIFEAQTDIPGVNEPGLSISDRDSLNTDELWREIIEQTKHDDRPTECPNCGSKDAWVTYEALVMCEVCGEA